MENVGQFQCVEQAQHLWRIGPLHLLSLGGGTLQNHCPCCREQNDQDEQNDAGLDCAEGLPDFSRYRVDVCPHCDSPSPHKQSTLCAIAGKVGEVAEIPENKPEWVKRLAGVF